MKSVYLLLHSKFPKPDTYIYTHKKVDRYKKRNRKRETNGMTRAAASFLTITTRPQEESRGRKSPSSIHKPSEQALQLSKLILRHTALSRQTITVIIMFDDDGLEVVGGSVPLMFVPPFLFITAPVFPVQRAALRSIT